MKPHNKMVRDINAELLSYEGPTPQGVPSPLASVRSGQLDRAIYLIEKYYLYCCSDWLLLCAWQLAIQGDVKGTQRMMEKFVGVYRSVSGMHNSAGRIFADIYALIDVDMRHLTWMDDWHLSKLSKQLFKQGEIEKAATVEQSISHTCGYYMRDRVIICKAMLSINREMALGLVKESLARNKEVSNRIERMKNYAEAASFYALADSGKAEKLLDKVIVESQHVSQEDSSYKDYMLSIIEMLVQIDLSKAMKAAGMFPAGLFNKSGYIKIVEVLFANHNRDMAAQVISELIASDLVDGSLCHHLLVIGELDLALKVANHIDSDWSRSAVAKEWVKRDLDRAWDLAKTIQADLPRFNALSRLLEPLFLIDKAKAYMLYDEMVSFLLGMDDGYDKKTLLEYLVDGFSYCDIETVAPLLNAVSGGRSCLLTRTMIRRINNDLDQGLSLISKYSGHIDLDMILPHVLNAVNPDELDFSSTFYTRMNDLAYNIDGWCGQQTLRDEIAKVLIPIDVERAWGFIKIKSLISPSSCDYNLNVLVKILAPFDLIKAAELHGSRSGSSGWFSGALLKDVKQARQLAPEKYGYSLIDTIAYEALDSQTAIYLFEQLLIWYAKSFYSEPLFNRDFSFNN